MAVCPCCYSPSRLSFHPLSDFRTATQKLNTTREDTYAAAYGHSPPLRVQLTIKPCLHSIRVIGSKTPADPPSWPFYLGFACNTPEHACCSLGLFAHTVCPSQPSFHISRMAEFPCTTLMATHQDTCVFIGLVARPSLLFILPCHLARSENESFILTVLLREVTCHSCATNISS